MSEKITENIVENLIESQPDISEHVINQELDNKNKTKNIDGFDPTIHQIDENGQPLLTPTGRFKKKRAPRKSPGPSTISKTTDDAIAQKSSQNIELQCRVCGKYAANAMFTAGYMIGGDEFEPTVDSDTGLDERQLIESAFGDYFVAKNISDFPPGITLCLAISAYILPRLAKPKTRSRLGRVKNWLSRLYMRVRHGTLLNTGNDGIRENNTSKKNVRDISGEGRENPGTRSV